MEVRIPIKKKLEQAILKREWDEHIRKTQKRLVGVQDHYLQMGNLGKIFMEIFKRENHARVKACENPDIIKFLKSFIRVAKMRAKELGYDYKDIQVSTDSGITENGIMEFRFEPKPGAVKLGE